MNARWLIILCGFCIALWSCAPRSTDSVRTMQQDVQRLDSLVGALAVQHSASSQTRQQSDLLLNSRQHWRLFSAPDSLGRQYVVAEGGGESHASQQQQTTVKDSAHSKCEAAKKYVTKLDELTQTSHDLHEDIESPISIALKFALWAALLILIIFFIFKKLNHDNV